VLNYTVETELLMNEIEDSTSRISPWSRGQAVLAAGPGPYQVVDVHETAGQHADDASGQIPPESTCEGLRRSLPHIPPTPAS